MISAPLHPCESQRLSTLLSYEVLGSGDEDAFDELTQLASAICGTPISLISLVDDHRQWFKSKVGLDASETSKDIAFCSHAILQENIFEIRDARNDERFHDNPLVTGAPDIRFYAGAPLVSSDGMPIGTLCVIDQEPRVLSEEQRTALKTLAKQVIGQLELRLNNRRLERMNKQRDAFFSMVAHDLRSPFSGILGCSKHLSLNAGKLSAEKISSLTSGILESSTNIYQLLDELLQWSQTCLGQATCTLSTLALKTQVEQACALLIESAKAKDLKLVLDIPNELQVRADHILLKTVIRNLFANAIKYSCNGGKILISAEEKGKSIEIAICDQGNGVDNSKLDSLFNSSLNSEPGSAGEDGTGLGLMLCKIFLDMQGGEINYDENYAEGARFAFRLPCV